jgi:hypothetical protein
MICPRCGTINPAERTRCSRCSGSTVPPPARPHEPLPFVRPPTARGELALREALRRSAAESSATGSAAALVPAVTDQPVPPPAPGLGPVAGPAEHQLVRAAEGEPAAGGELVGGGAPASSAPRSPLTALRPAELSESRSEDGERIPPPPSGPDRNQAPGRPYPGVGPYPA